MNKQEIERALQWATEILNLQEFERATYEDTCGTGDLTEEERREIYEAMDNDIELFKTIKSALQQQLNNGRTPDQKEALTIGDKIRESNESLAEFMQEYGADCFACKAKNRTCSYSDADCLKALRDYLTQPTTDN